MKRKSLKDLYYNHEALEINCSAEAIQVEKELLVKTFSMHKSSSKIYISKEKLTKHSKQHFSERLLEIPSELGNPDHFEYLKDSPIEVNEDSPSLDEIKEASKTVKNNKSFGTVNVPTEGVK